MPSTATDSPNSAVRDGAEPIPIDTAVELWCKHMRGMLQFSDYHAKKSVRTLRQVAKELNWATTADVAPGGLVDWLSASINAGGDGAAKTAKNKLSQIRCFTDYLTVKRHFKENPLEGVRLPRCRKGKGADAFTWAQMQAIILNAESREQANWQARHNGPLASTFYGFLALSGLRYREARTQLWSDINLSRRVMKLSADKSRRNDLIPLNDELVALLCDWRNYSKGERVFDRAPSHHTLEQDMRAVGIARGAEAAGEKGQWHRWRKGVNTQMARDGVDVDVRRKLLRHTDEKLTLDVYTDPRLLPLAKAMNQLPRMNGFMERGPKSASLNLTQGGQISDDVGAEVLFHTENLTGSPDGFAVSPAQGPQQSKAEKREPLVETVADPSGLATASEGMEPGGIEPPALSPEVLLAVLDAYRRTLDVLEAIARPPKGVQAWNSHPPTVPSALSPPR